MARRTGGPHQIHPLRSLVPFHGQCISHAVVINDAYHIQEEVVKFKKRRIIRGGF